jgi:hypothetical protein
MKYGLMVFREGTIIDDDIHRKRCSQIITQMSGCNIYFQLQFVVWSHKDQHGTRTRVVLDQLSKISSLESIISQGRDIT